MKENRKSVRKENKKVKRMRTAERGRKDTAEKQGGSRNSMGFNYEDTEL